MFSILSYFHFLIAGKKRTFSILRRFHFWLKDRPPSPVWLPLKALSKNLQNVYNFPGQREGSQTGLV